MSKKEIITTLEKLDVEIDQLQMELERHQMFKRQMMGKLKRIREEENKYDR